MFSYALFLLTLRFKNEFAAMDGAVELNYIAKRSETIDLFFF